MGFKKLLKKGVEGFKEYNKPENRKKRLKARIEWEKDQLQLEKLQFEKEKLKSKKENLFEKKKKEFKDPFQLF